MLAIVKESAAPGVTIKSVPNPIPAQDEVLIEVLQASICGTDIAIYDWTPWAASHITPPTIIGHEVVGKVLEVNSNDSKIEVGDIVSSETHIFCNNCPECLRGNFHICENLKLFGIGRDGGFAQYATIPVRTCWKNDPSLDIEVMSIQEPLGNAVHAVSKAQVKDKKVLILGLGPVGLCCGAVSLSYGAKEVIGLDQEQYRVGLAQKTGYFSKASQQLTGKNSFDVVFEVGGSRESIQKAFESVRIGGKIVAIGIPKEDISVDWGKFIISKELTIESIFGRKIWQTWEEVSKLLKENKVDLKKIITHHFPLSEFETAMGLMKGRKCGKIILDING